MGNLRNRNRNYKNDQIKILKVKIMISKIKNLLNELNSKLDAVKVETKEPEAQKVKNWKKRIDPRDNVKRSNIGVTGVPEGEEKETESEKYLKTQWLTFPPHLVKNVNPQIPESQQTSRSKNTSKTTPRHIVVTLLNPKVNRKTSKIARQSHIEKQKLKVCWLLIRNNESWKTMEWHLKVLKGKKLLANWGFYIQWKSLSKSEGK